MRETNRDVVWPHLMPSGFVTAVCFYRGTVKSQEQVAAQVLQSRLRDHALYVCCEQSTNIRQRRDGVQGLLILTNVPMVQVSAIIANVKRRYPDFTVAAKTVRHPQADSIKKLTSMPSILRVNHG